MIWNMSDGNRLTGFSLATFSGATIPGGANFLAVRFSNQDLDPFWVAGLRFAIAGLLFVAIALGLRLRWPRGRQLFDTVVYGLVGFTLFYALMYWALVRVTAGMATVVLAVVPLVTLLLAGAQRLERLTVRPLLGSLLALAGILWITIGPDGGELPIPGLLAMLAAAVCVGESVIIGKRLSGNHPVITNAVAMPVGTIPLVLISAVAGEQWKWPSQGEARLALLYLVTLGSVGLFVLVLLVVRHWTASASSYMFVLFPIVTMLLGVWLADEPITSRGVIGALLVMAGVWFGALSPSARATPQPVAASADR